MPKQDSTAKGIRIENGILKEIQRRAHIKGISFNAWINWAITLGLRSHGKRNGK